MKIIHIIRDGRDAALSIRKLGWHGCKSKDTLKQLLYAGLNWQESVICGREAGARYPNQYMELHYEYLVNNPSEALTQLSDFVGINFCQTQMENIRFGSLKMANSEFMSPEESARGGLINTAVGRWRNILTEKEAQLLSAAIGKTLTTLDYQDIGVNECTYFDNSEIALIRLRLKLSRWLRLKTILGRLSVGRLLYSKDVAANIKASSYSD